MPISDPLLERVRPIAKSYFSTAESVPPAHDWHHVERVETLSERIAAERSDLDERVLGCGVLLHDIGRGREDAGEIDDHATWGATEARRILGDADCDPVVGPGEFELELSSQTVDAIAHCIQAHRYSNEIEPRSPEARVLSDADNLDALGAIGLARVFSFGGEKGFTIYDPARPPETNDSSVSETGVDHIHAKILDLPNRMYTDEGRTLARERVTVVEEFLEQLEAEVAGER